MRAKNVFGITGWKNSGKTTLIVALVEEFTRRGLRVSTIKHAHHAFDIDVPGKDSHRHRLAGASEVLVGSGARWALMHELRGAATPSLDVPNFTNNGTMTFAGGGLYTDRTTITNSAGGAMEVVGDYAVPVDETASRKMNGNVVVGVRPEAWRLVEHKLAELKR